MKEFQELEIQHSRCGRSKDRKNHKKDDRDLNKNVKCGKLKRSGSTESNSSSCSRWSISSDISIISTLSKELQEQDIGQNEKPHKNLYVQKESSTEPNHQPLQFVSKSSQTVCHSNAPVNGNGIYNGTSNGQNGHIVTNGISKEFKEINKLDTKNESLKFAKEICVILCMIVYCISSNIFNKKIEVS